VRQAVKAATPSKDSTIKGNENFIAMNSY